MMPIPKSVFLGVNCSLISLSIAKNALVFSISQVSEEENRCDVDEAVPKEADLQICLLLDRLHSSDAQARGRRLRRKGGVERRGTGSQAIKVFTEDLPHIGYKGFLRFSKS
ncbi:hypothetical protein NL676_018267 [Syzygium grande]|nr:hypothetical protein NL676_018267 [Syzygium grande]